MKKILITAAVAIFAVSAYAQTSSSAEVKAAKETRTEDTESSDAKMKSHDAADLNKDGKLSPEEKAARKAARKAEKMDRKDLKDDGIINGSVKDNHGTEVSTLAKETTLEGKEKGKAVSDLAKSKARNGEKTKHHDRPEKGMRPEKGIKPEKGIRPEKGMRPSGAGKPAGMHRPGKG